MKKKIEFDSGKKVFPIIIAVIGAALMLAMCAFASTMVRCTR